MKKRTKPDDIRTKLKNIGTKLNKEFQTVKNIFYEEAKVLTTSSIFTYFLILFSLIRDTLWDFQTITSQFLDRIFSWNTALSIICTGLTTTIYKLCKNRKVSEVNREKYYWVSITFLDRSASIFSSGLAGTIVVLIYTQIFYCKLDDGTLQDHFSRVQLFLMGLILTFFFLGMNIIFKYRSVEITRSRETGQSNYLIPIVFAILYVLFFIIPTSLIKLLK